MFNGFPEEGLNFLFALEQNNNRTWFTDNRTIYKDYVEAPAKKFLDEMINRLPEITKTPIKGKIFRIHRDIRFSKDKTPYNPHVRMLFSCANSRKHDCGSEPSFYFSLSPQKITIGAGSYQFPKETLESYRYKINAEYTGSELENLLNSFVEKPNFTIAPPELKRIPTGFTKDHPREHLLRKKGLVVWYEYKDLKTISTPKIADEIFNKFKDMQPLYEWVQDL